jgi:hypothetical protein
VVALFLCCSAACGQTKTLPLPKNYKTTLENSDLLVMRVHYGAREFVPMHDHSAYPTVYVYLNDSGEIEIRHEGPTAVVRRPPTHTGAFRVAPGMAERHSVTNLGEVPSDFLRVELKRPVGDGLKKMFRGDAPAQPLVAGTRVEFQDAAIRVERAICSEKAVCVFPAAGARSLLIAVTASRVEVRGAEHWLKAGDVMWLANGAEAPHLGAGAQCLRVVLLGS